MCVCTFMLRSSLAQCVLVSAGVRVRESVSVYNICSIGTPIVCILVLHSPRVKFVVEFQVVQTLSECHLCVCVCVCAVENEIPPLLNRMNIIAILRIAWW